MSSVLPAFPLSQQLLRQIWLASAGEVTLCDQVRFVGAGALPSVFAVTDLAAASVAAAGLALAQWRGRPDRDEPAVTVDRRLASLWFASTLAPQGWTLPPAWDALAGDYPCQDGWIRLHTNAPHHRRVVLQVLNVPPERPAVAQAVLAWQAEALEAAVAAAGGCAARMGTEAEWRRHPQGQVLAQAPLLAWQQFPASVPPQRACATGAAPLAGVRVLDLTRIIAGPVATRFLAAAGAEVLRIDPPDWQEPGADAELTLGKRCARLNLKTPAGLAQLEGLLAEADVLVHGYRSDALARLGLSTMRLRAINPGLVDVALDAYGWQGPWAMRRGFDSLVQMRCGIAEAGMRQGGHSRPTPLPVQALDHATGYLLACAALQALRLRQLQGGGYQVRTSLARVAALLQGAGQPSPDAPAFAAVGAADWQPVLEQTSWGPAARLRWPLSLPGLDWPALTPAGPLGRDAAGWAPDQAPA